MHIYIYIVDLFSRAQSVDPTRLLQPSATPPPARNRPVRLVRTVFFSPARNSLIDRGIVGEFGSPATLC